VSKHSITLIRDGVKGFLSSQRIGTDALNALLSIPGVENPEIVSESDEQVELTYNWVGEGQFWETSEYLLKFGLSRADLK
jgi:hypothetical protein